tara:strand:+ start:3597 stop:4379 length:783 start_codon:yes stop_codon:yes gene_type:complete
MRTLIATLLWIGISGAYGQGNIHTAGEGGVFTQNRLAALKTGEGGLGNNPQTMNLFSDMRLKLAKMGEEVKLGLDDIDGTIYLDPEFQLGTLYYEGEAFKKLDLRYDAYNDEFEVKDSGTSGTVQALVKYSKLSCTLGGDQFLYTRYLDGDNNEAEGYLSVVYSGPLFTLYQRDYKLFKEGKPAKTSLGTSFPHRFVDETDYYMATENEDPVYLKTKKTVVSKAFGGERVDKINAFIKDRRIDLGQKEDLKSLFIFANTL